MTRTIGRRQGSPEGIDPPIDRLATLTANLTGTSSDNTRALSYLPTNQITQTVQSNDAYAFNGLANSDRAYTEFGLNQLTQAGSASMS